MSNSSLFSAITKVACWLIVLGWSVVSGQGNLAEVQAETPKSTAVDLSPTDPLLSLHVPEGFVVERVAEAPLIKHPIMACLDDRGRLFVCENAGVNMTAAELEEHLPNSIRLLEDVNGDGIYDRSTVFADKMTFPMGACWIDGSLYVASAPYIWKLTDTDGDGVADERIQLVSRFGYTGNAADIHGCFAGPEGRIYWCGGFHGHEFRDEEGELVSKRAGSYLFSCQPDGSDVRLHCGGGMDNPVEIDFTETGDLIGTVNIIYTRPRVDAMVHWLHGGVYPHREKILEELRTTGDLLTPFHDYGHVAISGTMRYRSGAVNPSWRDNYFATFFNLGKVVRLELTPQGSTYQAVQREFLASDSRDFHPTDVLEDVDGSLLVLDTGGWFYRGCPTSQISKPEIHGGIYRIRPTKLPSREQANGNDIRSAQQTPQQLTGLFADSRFRVREWAVTEAARRGAEMLPALEKALSSPDPLTRRNTAWALGQIINATALKTSNAVDHSQDSLRETAQQILRSGLKDSDPTVRQVVCHLLANIPDAAAFAELQELLIDKNASVRRMAATALGRSGNPTAVPALLQAIGRSADREEEHAVLYALLELNDSTATLQGLKNANARIRRGCLIVLDQLQASELTPEILVAALTDPDPQVPSMALQILRRKSRQPEYLQAVRRFVAEQVQAESALVTSSQLAELLALFSSDDQISELIGQIFQHSQTSVRHNDIKTGLLTLLPKVTGVKLHSSWADFITHTLESQQPEQIAGLLPLLQATRGGTHVGRIQQTGKQETLPRSLRMQLLSTLPSTGGGMDTEAFHLLLQVFEQPESVAEKSLTAQLLGNAVLTPAQLVKLAELFNAASTTELRELIRPFQRSMAPEVAAAFLDSLEKSRFVANIPQQEISDIIKGYPAEYRERGNLLLDRLKKLEQEKLSQVDRLLPLLEQGNVQTGREIYFSEKSKCATCHRVGEAGRRVGPDLTTIGANRAARDLLESILFPSATIVRDYNAYTVVLADGRVLTGLIAAETQDAVEIQQATGTIERIPRDDIEELSPSEISVMPSGLEKALTEQELADLIAYLISLKETPESP